MSDLLGSPSEGGWLVSEEGLDRERMRFHEAILTVGNGYLGARGALEEGYEEGYAGTYLAGVYDKSGGQSFAIVNAPNPLLTEIQVDGKRLCADEMEVLEHGRILDLRKAVLSRRTVFAHSGQRYEYESARFFSLSDMHTGVMRTSFRALDSDAPVVVRHMIDGTTRNEMHAVGGPIKHYAVTETSALADGVAYLEAETNDLGTTIGMAVAVDASAPESASDLEIETISQDQSSSIEHSFRAKNGERYQFDRYISIHTSRETAGEIRAACVRGVATARRRGVLELLEDHERVWEKRWQQADISIDGDPDLQRSLRFSMYHLLIAAPPDDIDVSIAPKSLSGEWYQGHIFWDTEIFVLPFFVYTHPELAKHLLLYRARRLEQARDGAAMQGYAGALWPWESADSGREETPPTWVNYDGTVLPVHNATREHHIACDIVYAIRLYHQHTGDDGFMLDHGLAMVFQTARFWASRVSHDAARDSYEIKLVIGPNEFQEGVDNNSYTNALTRWALRYACRLYKELGERYPAEMEGIVEDLGLTGEEIQSWQHIADRMVFLMGSDGLIEEFAGYFDRRNVTITDWDEHGMPVWPPDVELTDAKETQLIKQADVVLLLYLLSDEFSPDVKRVNLDYYEPRTAHLSSLSMTSYAILANELGETAKAYAYLRRSADSDLENIHGNTHLGIHAGEVGGAWQIVVRGFGGVRAYDGVVRIDPNMPKAWQSMRFHFWFRDQLIEVAISHASVELSMVDGREPVELSVWGTRLLLQPGGSVRVER